MPPENEDLFLEDRAITSEEDDEFGHKEYADSLERILRNANPPWHIGIFGEWGSGKTSIIRMLYNRLREKKEFEDTVFVEFDAWSHAEGSIRTELLLELDERIGKEVYGDDSDGILGEDEITGRLYDVEEEEDVSKPSNPKEVIVNFWEDSPILAISFVVIAGAAVLLQYIGQSTLASVAVTGLLLPILGYILQQLDTVAQTIQRKFLHPRKEWSGAYQRIFEDIIEESNAETIVISIDNLDRCESSTVYDVLVSLKTFMENDNCIYLIPCDDKALESHIKSIDKGEYFEEGKNEREFLRKFFQTHIRIPPFLPEDIEEYTEKENQRLTNPFEEEALDVLTNAYIDNPRRIKHALNRLSTLRVLAEEVEETGGLTEGRITDNIPFLAKVSILEEEYPDFYGTLSENPRLLEDINDYFRDQLSDSDDRNRIENILKPNDDSEKNGDQESRLEAFLRSTRRIQVENPDPFLNLSEPSYATSLTDVDAFLQNLRTGQEEDVRKELEQVDDYGPYVDAIESTVQEYTTKRREQPLFGTIDTTIAVFDEFNQRSQGRLIQLLGEYLTVEPGKGFLIDLDPSTLFPIIIQMRESDSTSLLEEYAVLVGDGKELRENILEAFVENAEDIPPSVARKVSSQISSLDDEVFKNALTTIESSEKAKNRFIFTETLKRAVSMIELQDNKNEFTDTEYYTLFDDVASKGARGDYVTHLLEQRQDYSSNQEQQVDQELAVLLLDTQGGILQSSGKEVFDTLREIVEGRGNQQPIDLVEVCFHFYDSFPRKIQQEFHSWIDDLLKQWNANNKEQLFVLSEDYEVPILESEVGVNAILSQIPNPVDNEDFVKNTVVPAIPEEFNQQLHEKVKSLIKNNNNNYSRLGIDIFTEYAGRFEPVWGEVIEICGNQANRENNVNRKERYLEAGSEIFSKLDGPEQENYLGQIDNLLSGNQNEYQLYRDLWNKIASDVDADRKETVAEDVRDELAQAFSRNQNPGQLDALIEVMSSITGYLTEDNGQQFMDRISNQLKQNNLNDGQKARVLGHISEFDEFFGKEDVILDRVEIVLKQSNHNNVEQKAEELLNKFEEIGEADQARIDQIREDYLSE
ncbi:KAP family P-loop NTPase fold protein [Halovenus sp. HT40]|uniref:KAP family P-loop NTPase fold protein n=1 Tax=Halovenus sp. HT40 TaxID=3126691 RepID=UPI00300F7229